MHRAIVILCALLLGCQTTRLSIPRQPDARIGIQIRSLKTGKVLYEQAAHERFIPASTLKIFTAAAALAVLKPSYRYETQVFWHEKDLYLKGSGDPQFSVHDLDDLSARVKQLVSKPIRNIIVDASIFDDNYYGEGWEEEDQGKGFAAPVAGINVNFNRIVIGFLPDGKLIMDPLTKYAKTHKQGSRLSLKGHGLDISADIPKSSSAIYKTYAIKNPSEWAGFLFREALARAGVKVTGQIMTGKTPDGLKPLTSAWSPYLSEQIIRFTKFSNNLGNEALLKTLGAGSFEKGRQVVKDYIGADYASVDGSGLSRFNGVTPAQMNNLLVRVWDDFDVSPELVAALPIAGEDGTLSGVFKNEPIRGNLRAKTGYMKDIKCLAGYYKTPRGEIVAVTVFANDVKSSTGELQNWLQGILLSI